MDKPVSIIIPCFNHGKYLLEALVSIENCDNSLFEAIIINDGSTEPDTLTILDEVGEKYKVIHQKNSGLCAARNAGIAKAKGRYILPLDADNRIYPGYLEHGIPILDANPEVAVVYGKRDFFGDTSVAELFQPGEFDLARLAVGNYIDACALIRKTALTDCGNYATDLPEQGLEDWDLWLSLASKGWKFHFLDEVVYGYRFRPTSMARTMVESGDAAKNTAYIASKHAMLFRGVLTEQYFELKRRRGWIPYWLRMAAKRLRDGPQN